MITTNAMLVIQAYALCRVAIGHTGPALRGTKFARPFSSKVDWQKIAMHLGKKIKYTIFKF